MVLKKQAAIAQLNVYFIICLFILPYEKPAERIPSHQLFFVTTGVSWFAPLLGCSAVIARVYWMTTRMTVMTKIRPAHDCAKNLLKTGNARKAKTAVLKAVRMIAARKTVFS